MWNQCIASFFEMSCYEKQKASSIKQCDECQSWSPHGQVTKNSKAGTAADHSSRSPAVGCRTPHLPENTLNWHLPWSSERVWPPGISTSFFFFLFFRGKALQYWGSIATCFPYVGSRQRSYMTRPLSVYNHSEWFRKVLIQGWPINIIPTLWPVFRSRMGSGPDWPNQSEA